MAERSEDSLESTGRSPSTSSRSISWSQCIGGAEAISEEEASRGQADAAENMERMLEPPGGRPRLLTNMSLEMQARILHGKLDARNRRSSAGLSAPNSCAAW